MLVTVVRSYSPEVVELPDGTRIRPWTFAEFQELPESLRGSGLKQLVDAGKVKVSQVLHMGAHLTQGAENRLSEAITGEPREPFGSAVAASAPVAPPALEVQGDDEADQG